MLVVQRHQSIASRAPNEQSCPSLTPVCLGVCICFAVYVAARGRVCVSVIVTACTRCHAFVLAGWCAFPHGVTDRVAEACT